MKISTVTVYRDDADHMLEEERTYNAMSPLSMFGESRYFAPVNVTVNTPQGPMPLNVRVPLVGATGVEDAFARLEELVKANIQETVSQEIVKRQAVARNQATRAALMDTRGVPK
jgi:hypothetical protein